MYDAIRLVLITLIWAVIPSTHSTASAQELQIRFMIPETLVSGVAGPLEDLMDKVRRNSMQSIELDWQPLPNPHSYSEMLTTFQHLESDTRAALFLIGWSVHRAEWLYDQGFRPDWASANSPPVADDDMTDGMIALGAGWAPDDSKRGLVLSVPSRRGITLPIVTMTVIGSNDDFHRVDEVARDVADTILKTQEGNAIMRAVSMIPNGPKPPLEAYAYPADFGLVEVLIRPERDDDGDDCDCDDGDNQLMSCDPDGYVIGAMSELERRDNGVLLPTNLGSHMGSDDGSNGHEEGGDGDGDGDGECDKCSDLSVYEFERFNASGEYHRLANRLDHFEQELWEEHMHDLFQLHVGQGKRILIMTCDPD